MQNLLKATGKALDNIGLDFGMKRKWLGFEFDYFYRKRLKAYVMKLMWGARC